MHDFVCHYYPNVLDAMRARWISPQFIATNRVDSAPDYAEVKEMGRRVNAALGIGTSATHMEWFFGPKGLKFSEIGCRPPGRRCVGPLLRGNDMDLYREWAHAIVHGTPSQRPVAPYSAGIIALRPIGTARSPATPGSRRCRRGTARTCSTRTCPIRVLPPSRSRPATWPTRTSGCATPTTTSCAACSTTWAETVHVYAA